VSLDGVDLATAADVRPGAYQLPSALSLPRRTVVRVGAGDCGAAPCDVDASVDNEIQRALWSAWPGSVVEVYPAAAAYAGNAVIGWPVTLRGVGDDPEAIVLRSREEDPLLLDFDTWRHESVLTVLRDLGGPVTVEGVTIVVDTETEADDHGLFVETNVSHPPSSPHSIRRVALETLGVGSGLVSALYLGHDVVVQDVLIRGAFEVCVRFGLRSEDYYEAAVSTSHVVNLTCRLTGTVDGSIFADIAVELSEPAPLFRAQRRSSGDTGTTARDAPESFSVYALSARGQGETFDGFADGDGTYTLVDVETVADGDPFFASATDSTLVAGASAMDTGVDPSSTDSALEPGTSLDGVDRSGRAIDRGAYEQGI
jgi:hypothetical protein